MSHNARKRTITIGLFAVCTLTAFPVIGQIKASPPPPPPPAQNVVVVNGSGQPVPTAAQGTTNVAGTVNIGNTPSVNVTNTPTVGLESGASVNVTNLPDNQGNPTPLATLEAVQVYGASCGFVFGGANEGGCTFTAVPLGKQLVIQEFDASGQVETGNRPAQVFLENTITGANNFTYTFMASSGPYDYLATQQQTRVYVAGDSSPICAVNLVENSNGSWGCAISGFLVDVPAGQQGITVQDKKLPFPLVKHSPAR